MDQEKMMLLQKYDHVWQRVMPGADPFAVPVERENAGEKLFEKIAGELKDREYYLALARRGGVGKQEFFRMAAEEEAHARRLKARWFLAGGEWVRGCESPPMGPLKKTEALRERYGEECRSAEEYFAMAESARGCGGEMLRAMGRDEQRHAETVLRILERLM